MFNILLYCIAAFIWGSTWLAIKYQLGVVDPLVSVAYRFGFSAILLLVYCRIAGLNLRYSFNEHKQIALQGLLLFGVNYWFVYMAETELPSGLVAVIFSMIVLLNIFNSAIFLKTAIRPHVLVGALIGLSGIAIIFKNELFNFSLQNKTAIALGLCILSAVFASLGNITSAYNQKIKLPVIQTNAFGMLYGSIVMFFIASVLGKSINFDYSAGYVISLLYLSIFGSVIAFGAYLTLVGRIGADRAGYIALIFPIIALALSTVFEKYIWTLPAVAGFALILLGNLLVISKKMPVKIHRSE
ncbi:MAG: EamA family transporter [Calditrichaeota bacterium]|nr:MAG: EamA family transporter [Calditrichota bacterium]